jgi:hypothetical protein
MDQTPARGWPFYAGVALFAFSCSTFGVAALAPFLLPAAAAAAVATGAIVSGEVGFWVGVALLGKPFVAALKAKLTGPFIRKAEGERSKAEATT